MHPVTEAERETRYRRHYAIYNRVLVSPLAEGINQPGEVLGVSPVFPANKRGIVAAKPSLQRIFGYDPFLGATINADLDSPVPDATIQLDLGRVPNNLSPFMGLTGPAWDWSDFEGAGALRALFDTGIYISLETQLVSKDARFVVPLPPRYQGTGPKAMSAGATGIDPAWPPHIAKDVALLIIVSDGTAITVPTPAGFVQFPNSPVSAGTAGLSDSVRLAVYWCRATSNAMARPHIDQAGNHIVAQIVTYRGCIETGNPFDVNPVAEVQGTSSVTVQFPSITALSVNNQLIHIVGGATDTTADQLSAWRMGTRASTGGRTITERTDSWTNVGNGGGFGLADSGSGVLQGPTDGGYALLATASKQARLSILLRPPLPHSVFDTRENVPWRPFYVGRIDRADPAAGGGSVLDLKCRDMYADVLDAQIRPPPGESSIVINTETQTEGGNIEALLTTLFNSWDNPGLGHKFAVIGEPGMDVPPYRQQPMSALMAMREAGLQNGWDLRPRFGTAPYGEDVSVLTYYQPYRGLEAPASETLDLYPDEYFEVPSIGLSRDEVRNMWRVTPSDPPRTPVEVEDFNSIIKYGPRWASISEDATSLVRTPEQAQALGNALLSDTKSPKVMAEIVTRFWPWVEVNDPVSLQSNAVHLDRAMTLAISGYGHTLLPNGDGKTTLRTRDNAAAANREWRKASRAPKMHYVSADLPSGTAAPGARWTKTGVT